MDGQQQPLRRSKRNVRKAVDTTQERPSKQAKASRGSKSGQTSTPGSSDSAIDLSQPSSSTRAADEGYGDQVTQSTPTPNAILNLSEDGASEVSTPVLGDASHKSASQSAAETEHTTHGSSTSQIQDENKSAREAFLALDTVNEAHMRAMKLISAAKDDTESEPDSSTDGLNSMFCHALHGPGAPYEYTLTSPPDSQEMITSSGTNEMATEKSTSEATEENPQKAQPVGKPTIWANGRTDMCETLGYYRSFRSACYATGGLAYAFMFDDNSHPRDYMSANVVVARAGGSLVEDSGKKELVQAQDQRVSAQIRSLRQNIVMDVPVVLILGEKNTFAGIQVPYRFCVMGLFKVTHIWWEKSGACKILRMRFEILDKKKTSWWQPQGVEPIPLRTHDRPASGVCDKCSKKYEQVFLDRPMCLNSSCEKFWILPDGNTPDEDQLEYDPRFLHQSNPWKSSTEPPTELVPKFEQVQTLTAEDGVEAKWRAVHGMVCPGCGRCCSRVAWTYRQCPNCSFHQKITFPGMPSANLRSAQFPLASGPPTSKDNFNSRHVTMSVMNIDSYYRVNVFKLEGVDGCIAHFIAGKDVLEENFGPDWMWDKLIHEDIGLERRPLTGKADGLTNNFSRNFGVPYPYVAKQDPNPFQKASEVILQARSRLIWASKKLLGDQSDKEFNELLAIGYLPGQDIGYHSDGENELGPTIATLSLGKPAKMSLRMKYNHYHGIVKSSIPGTWVQEHAIPMASNATYRNDMNEWLRSSGGRSTAENLASVAKQYKSANRKMVNAKECISMTLRHGDIVIMHGTDIQKYFEHAVVPEPGVRFALTCRWIDQTKLQEKDRPDYDTPPDHIRYNGPQTIGLSSAGSSSAESAQETREAAEVLSGALTS